MPEAPLKTGRLPDMVRDQLDGYLADWWELKAAGRDHAASLLKLRAWNYMDAMPEEVYRAAAAYWRKQEERKI